MDKNTILTLARFKEIKLDHDLKIDLEAELNKIIYYINESTSEEAVRQNIQTLELVDKWIKKASKKHMIEFPDLLAFIEGYKGTSTISHSIRESSAVPTAMLTSLAARHSENSVIKINSKLNFSQIKMICRELFEVHQKEPIVFSIPRTHTFSGKVIGEISQRRVKIPVGWKIKFKTKEDEYNLPYIFGEKIPQRAKVIEEITGEFFLYRFLTKNNRELALFSTDPLKLDDYTVEGLTVDVEDIKIIGDAHKLINKFSVFFVHTAKSHIVEIKNHDQLFKKTSQLKLTGNKLFQYLCSYKTTDNIQVLEQPKWFIKLISAFLFHRKKGNITPFPMHLLWIAERGTGKTTFMESLHQKSGENQEIIAGSTSTIKYLIPSFKETNRPEMGVLAKSSRLAFVDEFFRIIRLNTKTDKNTECASMNDLLEHKDRLAGSGQGRIRTSMTARLLASTNPVVGTNDIQNLIDKFDDSFISRFMVYYQTKDHVDLINQKKKENNVFTDNWIPINEFLSLQDYLQSFDAKYDFQKLVEIYERFIQFFSGKLKGLYESRYVHHIECLMDGIVKTRCLTTRDKSFEAIEDDYKELEFIWGTIIQGWFGDSIDNIISNEDLPIESRLKFLPEESVFILEKLAKLGYQVKATELKDACKTEMQANKVMFHLALLRRGGFIKEDYNSITHYLWEDSK